MSVRCDNAFQISVSNIPLLKKKKKKKKKKKDRILNGFGSLPGEKLKNFIIIKLLIA